MSTQTDRILAILRDAKRMGVGVCGTAFLRMYIPTYSQRIGELRRAGHQISRETCRIHAHEGAIGYYTLEGEA